MKIGSLFSGAGGLDMAVEAVFGGEVVWQSEVDKAASTVLGHRFPGVPNLGDITQIDFRDVEKVDILCGGFPCQDVSAAGKRAGIKAGTRSGLWALFANAIDVVRPRLVVIENVRGLLSARAHRNLEPANPTVGDGSDGPVLRAAGAVLGDLADLGYDAQWTTVAAADVGAPHRRERVFILATDTAISSRDGLQQQDLSALQQRRGDRRPGQPGVCDCGDSACSGNASDSSGYGWDEGRPESARLQRGFDAAVSGDEPGVALLPTPTQSDGTGGGIRTGLSWEGTTKSTGHGGNSRLRDVAGLLGPLLPTPNTQDGNGGARYSSAGHQSTLPGEVRLLPTPRVGGGGDCDSERRRNSPGLESEIAMHYLPTRALDIHASSLTTPFLTTPQRGASTSPLFAAGNRSTAPHPHRLSRTRTATHAYLRRSPSG